MSVDLYNDCVVFPHRPNWTDRVNGARHWSTGITPGVTSAEDRAQNLTAPRRSIEFSLLADHLQERAILEARVLAAIKSGRACTALWSTPSYLTDAVGEEFAPITGATRWRPGDHIFFGRPEVHPNRTIRINCGGAAVGDWAADTGYSPTGAVVTTAQPIDTCDLPEPPPQAVLQSLRRLSSATPDPLTYTIAGLLPGVPCRIRCYFAELTAAFGHSGDAALFTVDVIGETTATLEEIEPFARAKWDLYRATELNFTVRPAADGTIQIRITPELSPFPHTAYHAQINAIEIHQYTWEIRQAAPRTRPGEMLRWSGRLLGVYDAGTAVYPMIFGTPSIDEVDPVTGRVATGTLRIREPLGHGTVAIPGQCPVEVCPVQPPEDLPWYIDGGDWPPLPACPGATWVESAYVWGLSDIEDPNEMLLPSQRACHLALHAIEVTNQVPPGATIHQTFWAYYGLAAERLTMEQKHQVGVCDPNNPEGDWSVPFTWYTTLITYYCP